MKKLVFLLLIMLSVFSCSKVKYYVQVSISTYPEGAKIYLDNNYIGTTPLKDISVKIGILTDKTVPISIRVEKPFYFPVNMDWSADIKASNQVINNFFKLKPGISDYTGDFRNEEHEVGFDKLFSKKADELLLYRSEISARYGASFEDKMIQDYFESQYWYKKNPDYSDNLLSGVDTRNIQLIDLFIKAQRAADNHFKDILLGVEYESTGMSLQFVSETKVLENGAPPPVNKSPYDVEYFNPPKSWYSYGPFIFVEQVTNNFTVYQLDFATRKIEWYKDHVNLNAHSQACLFNDFVIFTDIVSSGYPQESYDRNMYHPVKVFDGKAETAWLENLPEFGKDAYVGFTLNHEIVIDEVRINGGYFDSQYYSTNNRLKNVVLHYGDENSTRSAEQELTLKDIMEEQSFTLSPTYMQSFQLLIKEVYLAEGQEWNDTAISEISFYYKGKKIEIGLGEFSVFSEVDPE